MSSQELVTATAQHGHQVAIQGQGHITMGQRTALSEAANAGAVSIEQERAIAEAQGQLIMAKRFPRNLSEAHAELMVACAYPSFAGAAFYSVPNRGSGPSIRFAEEVARVYGNFEFGHRELSRSEGKSEIEVYAWDKEKNNLSKRQITVMHVTDTKNGPKVLRDQADIDNKIANVASKQVRGRILALLPKWLVEDAIQRCKDTIAGNTAEPIEARLRKMQQAFLKYGVNIGHLERYLGHKIEETLADELAELIGIFNALKEGTPAAEFFGAVDAELKAEETAAALADTAKASNAQKPAPGKRAAKSGAAVTPTAETSPREAADKAATTEVELQAENSNPGRVEPAEPLDRQVNNEVAEAGKTAGDNSFEESGTPNPVVEPEVDDVF